MIAVLATAAGGGHESLSGSSVLWSLLATVALIGANGFFVAYEFAIIAARKATFENRAESGSLIGRIALDTLGDLSIHLAGAQLGITLASLALGFVGEPAIAAVLDTALDMALPEEAVRIVGFVIALSIVAFLHLVAGEMIPKNLAIAAPDVAVTWLVLPYRAYLFVVKPLVLMLNGLAALGCRILRVEVRDELVSSHSVAELSAIVGAAFEEGKLTGDDAELLHDALEFAQRPITDVASPISEIATIRFGATAAQAERVVMRSGQTRLPVMAPARGQQRLVGYLHAKDLLAVDPADRLLPMPQSLNRPMLVVRDDRSVIEVLRMMRRLRRQLAVVIGDGQPVAVVSVEQIIRALVEAHTNADV